MVVKKTTKKKVVEPVVEEAKEKVIETPEVVEVPVIAKLFTDGNYPVEIFKMEDCEINGIKGKLFHLVNGTTEFHSLEDYQKKIIEK